MAETIDPRTFLFMTLPFPLPQHDPNLSVTISQVHALHWDAPEAMTTG
jgi:hypothetical protein